MRQNLIDSRLSTADDVAKWVFQKAKLASSTMSTSSSELYPEFSANAVLALIHVACYLLDQQVKSLADEFTKEGGFTERLYRVRKANRVEKKRGY